MRWDYETNGLNNDYVTPANVVNEVRGNTNMILVNDDYFTDGDDRPGYKGMIQPRVGFSFDLTGRNSTILFGGFGRGRGSPRHSGRRRSGESKTWWKPLRPPASSETAEPAAPPRQC